MEITAEIKNFADKAAEYCSWAEGEGSEEDMVVAERLLAELQLSALKLPELDCGEMVGDRITMDEWKTVLDRFQNLPVDLYWDVFDPLQEEPPVVNSLPDDLADIYRDLKEGVVLYEQNMILEAVWEWRFNHQIHWGAHLTGAQRAIHSYLYH